MRAALISSLKRSSIAWICTVPVFAVLVPVFAVLPPPTLDAQAQAQGQAQAQPPATISDNSERSLDFPDQSIPAGSRLFIAPIGNGFETFVAAALHQKHVPIVVTTIRERAEFEMTGVSETDRAGWARMLITGSTATTESASVKVVNLANGDVVFACSVFKGASARGRQSAGEAVAVRLKDKISSGK